MPFLGRQCQRFARKAAAAAKFAEPIARLVVDAETEKPALRVVLQRFAKF